MKFSNIPHHALNLKALGMILGEFKNFTQTSAEDHKVENELFENPSVASRRHNGRNTSKLLPGGLPAVLAFPM